METVIAACITGGLALLGVILTNLRSNRRVEQNIQVAQAVTEARLEELTREVRRHNGFAERIPALEERVKDSSRRIAALEGRAGQPPRPEAGKEL
ncbi:MAG: hypothetical protein LUD69_09080 [Oscillospiraceae bacterium]|nr:hypothetical protein [Oscillospiraceae bacterium]MCD8377081.1 hypothetical protein [Oscillospiraceae bacterium]